MTKSSVLNTEILFQLLVKYLEPWIICDVGTLDASHSVLLRHISKHPRIIAFEANPYNYKKIIDSGIAAKENIEVIHKAVSNQPGKLTFHVQEYTDNAGDEWKAGTSSILERSQDVGDTEEVSIDAIRLDTFLIEHMPDMDTKSIALWIDVEGAGYEVLEGLSDIAKNILFIQVEVETEEVWRGQKLKPDVIELLDKLGFIEVGRGKHEKQHDLVLINKDFYSTNRARCSRLVKLSVIFYYIRKWGGHILSNLLLIPVLGIRRHN